MNTKRLSKILCAGALTALALPQPADAGGFYVARFGGEFGNVTSNHVVSVYYNPAGMSDTTGTRIYVEGLVARRQATYERPESAVDQIADSADGNGTPVDQLGTNAGTATLDNWLASPFVGVVSSVGIPNLTVGMATFVPFGGSASWDPTGETRDPAYPGGADGVQRWWAIDGSLRSMYVTGAAAYRVPKHHLSFGASLSWVRSSVHTIRARTATGTDDLISAGSFIEGRSLLDVEGQNFALGLGTQWQPRRWLRLGLSYQSQPGFGQMELEGSLATKIGAAAMSESNVVLQQTLPDVWRAGVELRATPQLTTYAQLTYTRWGVFRQPVHPRRQRRQSQLRADRRRRPRHGRRRRGRHRQLPPGMERHLDRWWRRALRPR